MVDLVVAVSAPCARFVIGSGGRRAMAIDFRCIRDSIVSRRGFSVTLFY